MATQREIKRRIASVKNTQQITRAMKMVSAAKLRKYQQKLIQLRPYSEELFRMVSELSSSSLVARHSFFTDRNVNKVCYVLMTADRGLCGSFNTNLIRAANQELKTHGENRPCLLTIGNKGYEYFRRREYPITGKYIDFFNKVSIRDAVKICRPLMNRFQRGVVDRVYVVYNRFLSIIHQEIVVEQFLPVLPPKETDNTRSIMFEPHPRKILDKLLPQCLYYSMYEMLLESFTAEQGARMTAMETATDNASEMIKNLVLYYNKARQAMITKEISEIVSGAEALRG